MAKHRAAEPDGGQSCVVMMDTVRLSRYRSVGTDALTFDPPAAEVFIDDLTLIAADDQFLDRIAFGRGDVLTDFSAHTGTGPGSLAPLLATWRAGIVDPQWPATPTAEQAVLVVASPRSKTARRALGPILGVAVAISALLFGSAAVSAQSARPGDPLWPLAQVLYANHASSVRAGIAAQASLTSARDELDHHNPDNAIVALTSASAEVEKVLTTDGQKNLQRDLNSLWNEATSSLQAASPGVASSAAGTMTRAEVAVVVGTPTKPAPFTRAPNVTTAATPSPSISNLAPTPTPTPTKVSPSAVTTAPGPAHTPRPSSPQAVDPPPASNPPSTAVITTAPTDPSPTSSDDSQTPDPVTTTAPVTDPVTPTSADSPGTEQSTTSELPTPTPTSTPTPDGQAGNAVTPEDVSANDVIIPPT